jgi:L-rhamnose mutarotase
MKRYCFAIDLVDDENLIEEYKEHHRNFWPELRERTRNAGINSLELYNAGNRVFMVWETCDDFDLNKESDNSELWLENRSKEWEKLMSKYQMPLPFAKPGEKWVLMEKFFKL